MVSHDMPSLTVRYQQLAGEITSMAENVTRKMSKLEEKEQQVFCTIRERLDQLMADEHVSVTDLKAVQELSMHLEKLAAQVQKVTGSFLGIKYVPETLEKAEPDFEDVVVPLCSAPKKPSQVLLPDGPLKKGMKKLDSVCDCIQIRGDGHCLFRAFATGLLCLFLNKKTKLEAQLRALRGRGQIGARIDSGVWDAATKALLDFKRCTSLDDVTRCMNNKETSQAITRLMRHLAAAYMEQQSEKDPEFLHTLVVELPKYADNPEQYFDDMRETDIWGGEREYHALGELFKVVVHAPQDVMLIGSKPKSGKTPVLVRPLDPNGINLLFLQGHYNLAIPKKN